MHMQFFSRPGRAPASGSANRRRRRDRGGALMMFTLLTPFVLLPIVGLAIDGTLMFSVKAKLQAAVDGAALAGAQSLSSGLTFAAQSATAIKTADEFIKANFVAGASVGHGGYWGAYSLNDQTCDANGNPTPSGSNACIVAAQDVNNKRTTVTISAGVNVPLLFMRILGFSNGTVAASAQAARRDVVMVLVLDRSSSMGPAIGQLQTTAQQFVTGFQSSRDRLGLVVMGGSALVAYPPSDWGQDYYTGTFHGPDTNFLTATPNMNDLIGQMTVGTNTGTAESLMLAYRELVAANQPGAFNVIVLFTDGQPNGITATFNGQSPNLTNTGTGVIKAGSTCTYQKNTPQPPNLSMVGWIAQGGGFKAGTNAGTGVNELAQTTTGDNKHAALTMSDWLATDRAQVLDFIANNPGIGCFYESSNDPAKDLTIPTFDYYGNPTTGSANAPFTKQDYKYSEIYSDSGECNYAAQTLASADDSCQIGLASWNAADMAGLQIRSDANLKPVIYTMMYTGDAGNDVTLMQRLSNINVPGNTVYDATKTSGKYYNVPVGGIQAAFASLAEEILRLSM